MALSKNVKIKILELLKQGLKTNEIAKLVGCSSATVSVHKRVAGYELATKPNIDYKELQKFYDLGNTITETCRKFKIAKRTLEKVQQKGLFKSRSRLEARNLYHLLNPDAYKTSEETKEKISKSRKKFLNKNPEKHPQRILAHNRKNWTYPEKRFVQKLEENGFLNEIDWLHNKRILSYYPDFLFEKYKLIIEIDGAWFHKDKQSDYIRQKKLEDAGFYVIRFTAKQIQKQLNACFNIVKDIIVVKNSFQ